MMNCLNLIRITGPEKELNDLRTKAYDNDYKAFSLPLLLPLNNEAGEKFSDLTPKDYWIYIIRGADKDPKPSILCLEKNNELIFYVCSKEQKIECFYIAQKFPKLQFEHAFIEEGFEMSLAGLELFINGHSQYLFSRYQETINLDTFWNPINTAPGITEAFFKLKKITTALRENKPEAKAFLNINQYPRLDTMADYSRYLMQEMKDAPHFNLIFDQEAFYLQNQTLMITLLKNQLFYFYQSDPALTPLELAHPIDIAAFINSFPFKAEKEIMDILNEMIIHYENKYHKTEQDFIRLLNEIRKKYPEAYLIFPKIIDPKKSQQLKSLNKNIANKYTAIAVKQKNQKDNALQRLEENEAVFKQAIKHIDYKQLVANQKKLAQEAAIIRKTFNSPFKVYVKGQVRKKLINELDPLNDDIIFDDLFNDDEIMD